MFITQLNIKHCEGAFENAVFNIYGTFDDIGSSIRFWKELLCILNVFISHELMLLFPSFMM